LIAQLVITATQQYTEVKMIIVPIQDVYFDHEATFAIEAAFDQASDSNLHLACASKVRDFMAKGIVEAATDGERDPSGLRSRALLGFSIDDVSMPVVSVGRTAPSPACATVAQAA
jgi:hypothetical protein